MNKIYKFSEFILNQKTFTFYRQNLPIHLSSRAFEILLYLIERRGAVVGKNEILEKIWQDSFVEEANLPVHISALRRVLQEKKGESRFIKTISGRGYSFIADVREIEESEIVRKTVGDQNLKEKKDISIAVLPFTFENNSEDNEFLSNGITQSLIGDLSKIQDLRVLAYSAVKPYKHSELELQEIGFLLDADRILTGVISEYKGKCEISTELVNVVDKRCLWATSQVFEAEDIFEVKKEISFLIVEKLKLKLINNSLEKKEINYEAQKLYYRGKFILESRVAKKNFEEILYQALKFFKEAIEIEPSFALAYTGIGNIYCIFHNHNLLERNEAYSGAKNALKTALLNDADISDIYVLKATVEVLFEYNFAEAEKSLDAAIELNPNNADGYNWKSVVYLSLGEFEKALFYAEKVINLDSTSVRLNENLIRTLYFYEKHNEVIVLADELLEFNENSPAPHLFKSMSYTYLGLFDAALDSIEKTRALRNMPEIILFKACILGMFGKESEAVEILRYVADTFKPIAVDNYDIAGVYSALNNKDKTFEYLNRAFEDKSSGLMRLKIDPRFKSLRNEHRFDELLEKVNLK